MGLCSCYSDDCDHEGWCPNEGTEEMVVMCYTGDDVVWMCEDCAEHAMDDGNTMTREDYTEYCRETRYAEP